jgi:hypothetical protein
MVSELKKEKSIDGRSRLLTRYFFLVFALLLLFKRNNSINKKEKVCFSILRKRLWIHLYLHLSKMDLALIFEALEKLQIEMY